MVEHPGDILADALQRVRASVANLRARIDTARNQIKLEEAELAQAEALERRLVADLEAFGPPAGASKPLAKVEDRALHAVAEAVASQYVSPAAPKVDRRQGKHSEPRRVADVIGARLDEVFALAPLGTLDAKTVAAAIGESYGNTVAALHLLDDRGAIQYVRRPDSPGLVALPLGVAASVIPEAIVELSPNQRRIFDVFCASADAMWQVEASYNEIAKTSGVARTSIEQTLGALQKKAFIKIRRRPDSTQPGVYEVLAKRRPAREGASTRPFSRRQKVDQSEIERLYTEERLPCTVIAERLGCSDVAVRKRLKRAGVDLRTKAHQARLAVESGRAVDTKARRVVVDPKPARPKLSAEERRAAEVLGEARAKPPARVFTPRLVPRVAGKTSEPRRFIDLLPRQCRWPLDDPGAGEMHAMMCCARPRTGEGPYCEMHEARAAGRARHATAGPSAGAGA